MTEISTRLKNFSFYKQSYVMLHSNNYKNVIICVLHTVFHHFKCTKRNPKCAGNVNMWRSTRVSYRGLAEIDNSSGHRPLLHPGRVLLTFGVQG